MILSGVHYSLKKIRTFHNFIIFAIKVLVRIVMFSFLINQDIIKSRKKKNRLFSTIIYSSSNRTYADT